MITVQRITKFSFTALHLGSTERFYAALGFETVMSAPVDGGERAMLGVTDARVERLAMRLGRQDVEFLAFDPPGRPYPPGSTSTDLWFQHIAIVVSDMTEAHRRVLAAGAAPITDGGPQTLPSNTGGVTAFKFRDPEGHPLELLFFPPGIGEAIWQESGGASPFLGIDHSAVSVSDPERSRSFYTSLGLQSRSGSENEGPGQERLDAVMADDVAVLPLALPTTPPHVELLGYKVGLRRPMPAETRSDDVWATRIVMVARGLDHDGAASVPDGGLGARLIHDPDGHAIVLVDPFGSD